MSTNETLGLDELMIVNPGTEGAEGSLLGEDGNLYQVQGLGWEEALPGSGQFFLGEDGTLYQVEGLEQGEGETGLSGYFLGDDGILYRIESPDDSSASKPPAQGLDANKETSRFFLGEDGMLYEVVR
jgi:hypothetical protein